MGGWSGRSWDADLTGGASWGDVAEARGGPMKKKRVWSRGEVGGWKKNEKKTKNIKRGQIKKKR